MTITVQGYALPWDKPAYVDGLVETVAPRAVSAASARNIRLLIGSHEDQGVRVFAQTRDGTLRLFADDYGLAFSAALDDSIGAVRAAARTIEQGYTDECSVNFIQMNRRDDGRIIWGAIDHIAILSNACYGDTGCWLKDSPINQRNERIKALSLTYGESVIANSRRQGAMAGVGHAPGQVRNSALSPRTRSAPASVNRLLDDPQYQAFWQENARMAAKMRELGYFR